MPSSPILRARTRVLLFISICVALIGFVSLWTSREPASAAPDKGAITPAASTITVNSLADVANGSDGLCTLREAITAANNNAASGATAGECAAGSSSGSDTIIFSVTGTITLASALPNITSNTIVSGPGSGLLTVQRSTAGGTPNFRILSITNSPTVTVSGMTVTNGRSADGLPGSGFGGGQGDSGGGIYYPGTGALTLADLVVTANRTGNGGTEGPASGGFGGFGGGIYSAGTLIMTNSTVSNNTAGDGNVGNSGGSGGRDRVFARHGHASRGHALPRRFRGAAETGP